MADDERKPRPTGEPAPDPIDRLLNELAAGNDDAAEQDEVAAFDPPAAEDPDPFAAWAEAEAAESASPSLPPYAVPTDEPGVASAAPPHGAGEFPRDAIGAYLLDALSAADQATFIAFAESSPETIAELEELAPIAALLPEVFGVAGIVPAEPVAAPASATVPEAEDDSDAAQAAALAAANAKPLRAVGRLRAGVSSGPTLRESIRDESRWVKTGVVMIIVAVIAILWGLGLQGRIDDQKREIAAQADRLAELTARGNATAFMLQPAAGVQSGASGTAYYGWTIQRGVLTVSGLGPLAEGRVYQIWYLPSADGVPVRGETFTVDGTGQQVVLLQPSVPTIVQVMISDEPFGGSPQPTTTFLLTSAAP